jgi:hypothetical protein
MKRERDTGERGSSREIERQREMSIKEFMHGSYNLISKGEEDV